MEIDTNKLDTAIIYLQRIADGYDPVNNMPADENSVLNDPNVIRCMYFVKEVLEEVKRNNGVIGRKGKRPPKEEFPVKEAVARFDYQGDKNITAFTNQVNNLIDTKKYQKLSYKIITRWMLDKGYLEEKTFEEFGKKFKVPTEQGKELGIYTKQKMRETGAGYIATYYGKKAQEYIISNLERILDN